ncbi:hypothetical protein D9M72_474260 [compost metagenome]
MQELQLGPALHFIASSHFVANAGARRRVDDHEFRVGGVVRVCIRMRVVQAELRGSQAVDDGASGLLVSPPHRFDAGNGRS